MSRLPVITRTTLANGLRVVHAAMPHTAMVAVDVLYNVGARDEDPAHTGLAHLAEHCLFGPSQNVADYSALLASAGGIDNAWTSNDFTLYNNLAPAHNVETMFYAESDRMLRPLVDAGVVDVQRSVVLEEFKQQCLSRPYGDAMHRLRPMLYGAHPYAWPVIGRSLEEVAALDRDMLVDWYSSHYVPSNAVLAIAGNISADEALRLAEKWFGDIPSRPAPERHIAQVQPLSADVVTEVEGNVPSTMMFVTWLMDSYGTRRYFAADALSDILAAGRSSRLYRTFTINDAGRTFNQADASILGSEHQGLFNISAFLANEDIDAGYASSLLVDQLQRIATDGITDRELLRIKNRQLTMSEHAVMVVSTFCQLLALSEMHGVSPNFEVDTYTSLTAREIADEAARLLDSHHATLIYRPKRTL